MGPSSIRHTTLRVAGDLAEAYLGANSDEGAWAA